jgi:hypothetical protein
MAELFDPADMPREKFLEFLDGISTPPQQAPDELPASVDSQTRAAIDNASKLLNLNIPKETISPEGERMGIRPGMFLDISKGAGAGVRWSMGLDENQLNQFKMLNERFGPGNVELSDDGRFILRNQPTPSGGIEDVMVDPVGIDLGDIAQIGSQIIPMAAGAAAALLTKGKGWKAVMKAAGAGALVGEFTGAVQDAAVRKLRDDTINASEIAKHRATMAVADAAFGIAAAGGAKAATKLVEGIIGLPGVVGELSTEGMKQAGLTPTKTRLAQEKLAENTGVRFDLTPGQEAESPLLLRGENVIRARPGSASVMDAIEEAQSRQEEELRRVFLGLDRKLTDEEMRAALPQADVTGQKALQALRPEAARAREGVETALTDVRQAGSREAQMIGDVDLDNPLSSTDVGKALRARTVEDFQTFRTEMGERYQEFLSRPEIRARTVPGNEIAAAVKAVENKFVPKARRGAVTLALEDFVPAKFRTKVEALKSLKGKQTSINDLKIIRTDLDNAIKEGVAIPGTDVAQLEALREAVDDGISSALKGMDKLPSAYKDTAPLTVWNELRSDYAKGMSRFNRKPIREMLVREGEQGSIGDAALAERIMGDSPEALDNFNDYKAFFGEVSPEFQAVLRRARERVLETSKDELTSYVKGSTLRSRLRNLRSEVAEELFGANETELHKIGDILEKTTGNLDLDELSQLANQRGFTASNIQGLIDAETERVRVYGNKLIKAAASGTLDAEKIKPSDFVRTLRSMDPDDAQRVLGVLADKPELVRDIKQLAVEDIWERIQTGAAGQERVSGVKIRDVIGNETQQRTWEAVVGKDTIDNLIKFADVLKPRDYSTGAFKGSLAAQQDIQQLMSSPAGIPGEIKSLAVRYLMGVLYSGPLKRSVVNMMTSQDRSRFLNAVIASTPFIEGLRERFGPDGAMTLMQTYRSMVEPSQQKSLTIEGKIQGDIDPASLSPEEFKQWLQNAAQ